MILDEDVDSAEIVTFEEVTVTRKDGTTRTKTVTVPLFPAQPTERAPPVTPEYAIDAVINDVDMIDALPDAEPDVVPVSAPRARKVSFPTSVSDKYKCSWCKKTQRDYILEFVQNIDSLLPALLSREALPIERSRCDHCGRDLWAIWRCKDCCLARPLCRNCMRTTHWDNPFHKIERWTGTYFRSAELWEVGTYVLIPHHEGKPVCERLQRQQRALEQFEQQKDAVEQEKLSRSATARQAAAPPPHASQPRTADMEWDRGEVEPEDVFDDEQFEQTLDRLHRKLHVVDEDGDDEPVDDFEFFTEEDDETVVGEADADIRLPQYLPEQTEDGSPDLPTNDFFNNSYVRIVHTNGLHHLAMVSCQCRGAELLPPDLIASGLVPASFQRIRTLFSTQVLNFFRLCNLEMKASAYQFYHLLRRLTAPAEVVDLYNKFRRMTRLWRWMKKLKWAGYGHNGKRPSHVEPGELANYCPACPQPGINLPEDWKNDPNR